ncbi:hypothetical protein TNCV_2729091 [Trichonephila clavipes]|nr:hypothetical protein TNCV_2729091 [Trichonephila clavipes]
MDFVLACIHPPERPTREAVCCSSGKDQARCLPGVHPEHSTTSSGRGSNGGKKELIEWCMKEGLIASSYECPKCNEQMGLNERKSVVLDGFEWRCRKRCEYA